MPILSNLRDFLNETITGGRHRLGLLALDVSKRAIGVAGADAGWLLATPLKTIRRTRLKGDVAELQALLSERDAGALVIGLPLNMDGSEGPRCQAIRQFAKDIDEALGLPIILWDERLTTFAAKERADEMGLPHGKRADWLDALAAAALLEDMLRSAAGVAQRLPSS